MNNSWVELTTRASHLSEHYRIFPGSHVRCPISAAYYPPLSLYSLPRPRQYWSRSRSRMQDSGLQSRSSSKINTLPVHLLLVPLSKALHATLLLLTQEQMGTWEGRFVSLACERLYTPQGVEMDIQMDIWTVKAKWPGKVLVKVCRAELWAWMWTQNRDFAFF